MRSRSFCALLCLLPLFVPLHATESIDTCSPFGTVHLYYPSTSVSSVVLFISGDGGWNLGVVSMAKAISGMNSLVVGIDIRGYIRHCNTSSGKCCYPPSEFENLSKYIQKKHALATYTPPIVIGYSSGATLAYTLIAQAPHGTFAGAISMGFCPDLPIVKPFCRQNGLAWKKTADGKGTLFEPDSGLKTPWIAFQGDADQVCSPQTVDQYVKQCGSSRCVALHKVGHGFSVEKNWLPQFKAAFDSLVKVQNVAAPPPPPKDAPIADLPLVELLPKGTQKDYYAVILSGDGGWASIDKEIAGVMVSEGIPVVGFNSLQYFWKPRTPDELSHDFDRIVNHYCTAWKKDHLLAIGYSFGADVLPFIGTRLPKASLDRISLFTFIGLMSKTDFEFHLTDWIGGEPASTSQPVLPEIEKLKGHPMLYMYGTEENDNLSAEIDRKAVKVIAIDGGHHFGGNYQMLADSILAAAGLK